MAKPFATFAVAGLLAALAGCQAQPQLMVDALPAQNFGGPAPAQPQPAPAPPPVARRPLVAPLARRSRAARRLPSPRDWAPRVGSRPWRWIVLHHSATPTGGAAAFDKMHRAKGWDGLGYHFVVGNGTDTRDGIVEVGHRWSAQKHGAHAKTADNRYNEQGIGICLVGNFDLTNPSAEQMRSVSRLVAHLMKTYKIPPERILGHGQAKATDCPGRYMSIAEVRRQSSRVLAEAGEAIDFPIPPVATTLLHPIEPQ